MRGGGVLEEIVSSYVCSLPCEAVAVSRRMWFGADADRCCIHLLYSLAPSCLKMESFSLPERQLQPMFFIHYSFVGTSALRICLRYLPNRCARFSRRLLFHNIDCIVYAGRRISAQLLCRNVTPI